MSKTFFYRDKPICGLDLGNNDMRIMQLQYSGQTPVVNGYGHAPFPKGVMKDGVITDPEALAETTVKLIRAGVQGKITARRMVMAVPAKRAFSRAIKLPIMKTKDIDEAVRLEAEQYIPENLDNLYLDYTILSKNAKDIELFAVAAPKKIIDSYIEFAHLLDMEPVAIETTIHAAGRLFTYTDPSNVPTVLIDFGSTSADITIVDKNIIATGTVNTGGDNFVTRLIKTLGVNEVEAQMIISEYGLNQSYKQKEILAAIEPELDGLFTELRRMIRYFEERYGAKRKISQVVIMGVNIPGLSDKMTDVMRIAVRTTDPWDDKFDFGQLQPIDSKMRSSFTTAAGLAMIRPERIFA